MMRAQVSRSARGRSVTGRRDRGLCFTPRLWGLEARLLLSGFAPGASLLNLASVATPLSLDSPVVTRIAPLGVVFYQIISQAGGRLMVDLSDLTFPARISLVNSQAQPLDQSDGSATVPAVLDENVPAGVNYLEVQSLGGNGAYELIAQLTPALPPFQNIPSQFVYAAAIAVADVNGDQTPDLITPDGIRLGVGNGTFENPPIGGPLADDNFNVTGIAAADFNGDRLTDFAVLETSSDGLCADVRIFTNVGNGQFVRSSPMPVNPNSNSIQEVDLGDGEVDLAILDTLDGTATILEGNGAGAFTVSPPIDVGSQPVAIVSGQFGDGHNDLIVADQGNQDPLNPSSPGLSVLQYDGSGQFSLTDTIPLNSIPMALVAGDFGNGHLDLAIANENTNDVTILLGNGNGTFQSQTPLSYPVGAVPGAIIACSLRGNGILDLVTANENSNDISVLLGNGDGTFQPQVRIGVGTDPTALAAIDLNGDSRPDLVVANLESSDISVLIGRGDGTFQDQVTTSVGLGVDDAVTADLNHDGHLDIITLNQQSNDISVLLGNGDGTFESAGSFPAGTDPTSLTVGDFNGDGRLDVAVTDQGDRAGVSILLGNGDGTFQPAKPVPLETSPSSIVASDFTGDGVLDLAVTNPDSNDVSVLLGDGFGNFPTVETIPLVGQASEPVAIVAGDFTGDDQVDLAVANEGSGNISILQGNGMGGFVAMEPISLGDDPSNSPRGLVAGDFNGDGLLDLAAVSGGADTVSILLARGQGQFTLMPTVSLGTSPKPNSVSIISGHFFEGGPLDLAVADSNSSEIILLKGDGMGGFQAVPTVDLGSEGKPTVVTSGDFTGDGVLDLAVVLQDPTSVAIELNQGNGQFVPPSSVGLVPRNTPLVADFTGDGVPDVAIVDGAGDILFRQGLANQPGSFQPPITINTGFPSRGIAAVVTNEGVLLASVDATGNTVSWFAYQNRQFRLMGTLATGLEPAQIVSANLNGGGGDDDLIIRNAGDGTLTIYLSNPLAGGFLPPITLTVGPGISNVSVADINQDGRPDILLSNQTSGLVEVILNRGGGSFSQPTLYRAGVGLSAVIGGTDTTPVSLFSQDGTIGVAAATLVPDGPPDIVTLNSGAETLGILTGLGDGQFADPYSLPTNGPTVAVRVADLNGDGISDLAILGPDGLTIWLGNGQGGFVRGTTYNVGPDPTGLTIADINGEKRPDLLVGNAFGDVLVLLGKGNGLFQTPTLTDQSVALAVTYTGGSRTPTFIYSDQASDSVVVQSGSGAREVLGNRTSGLLVPGAPLLADLNGDGIPDLIIANTGGNSVLVYPGLPGGGFGPPLNNGNGFFTGTNPVAVVVANLNGRPDLIVANEGSNDVTVLLNEPQGNGFTFKTGPRINVGQGPVGLLYADVFGNGTDDLVVSDSGSNNLMVIPSLGNGFFNDADSTIIALKESPGQIFAGSFGDGTGLDIVALDPGTSAVTLIFGLSTGSPVSQDFSSGGLDPAAAFAVNGSNGFDDLVVANNADGKIALLTGGPQGLTLDQVDDSRDLLNPTGLALASLQNNNLEVYASTAGEANPIPLEFSLGGLGGPSTIAGGQALTLLTLSDSSLPLIATLLTPTLNLNATEEVPGGSPQETAAVVALATTAPSLGQGPFLRKAGDGDVGDGELAVEPDAVTPAVSEKAGLSPWRRIEIGLDEAFEEFRRATQTKTPHADGPAADDENELPDPAPQAAPPVRAGDVGVSDRSAMVDAAIDALAARYPVTPVMPALGCTTPPGMTNGRLKPSLLSSTALVILHAGLLARPPYSLAGRRRARRSDWRTGENDQPRKIPPEDA
jgi:hypothetical protein